MLSTKLVRLIEANWEEIATRLLTAVKRHPEMQNLAQCPDLEKREWCRAILENLGYLLTPRKDEEINRRWELLGRARFEERIPLHEAVLRLQMLKNKILSFIHEQGFSNTAVELYAEEELEQRLGRLFDALVYSVVRGYEDAARLESMAS